MRLKFTVSQRAAGREGRGEQSSFAFKAACKKTACCGQSCFDRVKIVLFYTTIENFLLNYVTKIIIIKLIRLKESYFKYVILLLHRR